MRKKSTHKYTHPIVTKGEGVYRFVRDQLNLEGPLLSTTDWMAQFDQSDLWSNYVEEFMSLNLTGRLIGCGRTLKKKYSNSTVFRTEYIALLSEHLSMNKDDCNRLFRLASSAVEASLENISNGTRNALTTWAKANHSYCYLCGRTLEFRQTESQAEFTIDHIWPREFGGDSIVDNLLPACKKCNSSHKMNYPSWAMTNIQSLLVGLEPSENSLNRVTGSSRYAIHHRIVQKVAVEKQITLKAAYLSVGHSERIRLIDPHEFGHFFNLSNHNHSF